MVTISFTVTSLGKVGTTSQIDEYGFFYSTIKSHLTSTDISTLKTGSATNIKYETTPQNKNTLYFYENALYNAFTQHIYNLTDVLYYNIDKIINPNTTLSSTS